MLLPILSHLLLAAQAALLPHGPTTLDASFGAWRAEHGPSWQIAVDAETGFAEMIYGGGAHLGSEPRTEEQAQALAAVALETSAALHGVDLTTLAPERVTFLPLGQIGSGDKWTVRYAQRITGLDVDGARVNVLIDASGRLLSVHSTAVAQQSQLAALPSFGAESAMAAAGEAFLNRHGPGSADATRPLLGAQRVVRDGQRRARAAWSFQLSRGLGTENPVGEHFWVDATDGSILSRESTIHNFDVTGTVLSRATAGVAPDGPGNPETDQVMKYARVASPAGTVISDANGNFNIVGVNAPLAVTVTYYGDFNDVQNSTGGEFSLTQTVQPNTPTTLLMNPTDSATITPQANAFIGVNLVRDWIRTINPTDATADMRFRSNVNLSQTCNAYFDGVSINFYLPGGGCPNTCYSTVISHELGHWLNVLYLTGNGSDGMGEGNADVWAMYTYDTPVIAQDFFGPGQAIRTGLNNQPFCGDANPGCYGQAHANGEPWMGAAWKVRNRLNITNGNAAGDLIADSVFLGWMNGYNQTQLRSIIETQWLTLDDNDANLANGTPHFADIYGGFRDQQFPGVTLAPFVIADVTQLPDTENVAGPYVVNATLGANFDPPLVQTVVRWRVNGGPFQDAPLVNVGGMSYSATIPGQAYPSLVQYHVQVMDSIGRTATWPPSVPEQLSAFDVGTVNVIHATDFEAPSAQGWTAGAVGDAPNPENDWARGIPRGRGGVAGSLSWRDPAAAVSGIYCWANDLGTTTADGAYSADVHSFLRSPVLNCSGATNVRLRFQSWLTIEGNALDQARVLVNGIDVYSNPAVARLDTAWGMQEYDISALAANNPSVQVEFRLRSNGTNQLGGWTIDDARVFWVSPVIVPCPAPQTYCITSPNSVGGGTVMGSSGTGNLILNNLHLYAYNSPPDTSGQFFYGNSQIQVPFGNGYRCVSGSIFRLGPQVTDSFGDASRLIDWNNLPSGTPLSGQTWNFQFWYRNPAAGGAGFNLSNALSVTVCD